jgi:hypothetical protein
VLRARRALDGEQPDRVNDVERHDVGAVHPASDAGDGERTRTIDERDPVPAVPVRTVVPSVM